MKTILHRISFDFYEMEAMMGFFDTFKRTNNPNYIKAELVLHQSSNDEDALVHHFIVRNKTNNNKDVNIIPMQKEKNRNE